ncbi:MAG: DUF6788 family protein, partial [Trebonia sp.]
MSEPSLPELEAERDRLYAQLSTVGDFRRGSVSANYRKCGKPNCACAQPGHPGHGPRFLWTRTAGDLGSRAARATRRSSSPTGQGHRHGPRAGHAHARLVPVQGVRARPRPARRRARRSRRVPVTGTGSDERPRRLRRSVRQGRPLLEDLAGIRLTAKRVERAAEASGAATAAAVRDRAALIAGRKLVPLPPSPLPDRLYAVIDGTGVPMTSKETAGRQGKGEDGRARTREVKLAVILHPGQARQGRLPGPRPRLQQRHRDLRARRR